MAFQSPFFVLKGLCLGGAKGRRQPDWIISRYNADGKRFFKQVLKGRRKGVLRREMNAFQSEGKVLRCPLQDKLFPSGFLGELFGGKSRDVSWAASESGDDSFLRRQLPSWANRQIQRFDSFFFLKATLLQATRRFPWSFSYPERLPTSSPSPCWPAGSPDQLWGGRNESDEFNFQSFTEELWQTRLYHFKANPLQKIKTSLHQ